jgi:hypothetical protein
MKNQAKNNTPNSYLKIFAIVLFTLFLGYSAYTLERLVISKNTSEVSNIQQRKTDSLMVVIAKNDSLVVTYAEQALFYKELHTEVKAKYDSLHLDAFASASKIDSLVHSDFESLSDSTKLAYREKVIARLTQ